MDGTNHKNLQPVAENSATCTAPGNNAYYYCSACDNRYVDAAGTVLATDGDIVIPAMGHAWSVTFTWTSADAEGASATAECVCNNNSAHNQTLPANVTVAGTTGADCGQAGSVTYKAAVTLDGREYSDTTVVYTDALAHIWNVTWTWNDTYTEATAHFVCERNPQHTGTETDTAPGTVEVTAAACGVDRVVKYTATVTFDSRTYETESDPVTLSGTALSHIYVYTSNGDGTHNVTCDRENCDYLLENVTCTGGTATCTEKAKCDYCHAEYGPEPAGHTYRYTSNGDGTHDVTCANCEYIEANVACTGGTATCTEKAVCDFCHTAYGPEPEGHSYGLTEWTWTEGYGSATAHFACTNSGCTATTEATDDSPAENTVSSADCGHNKVVTYTATVTLNGTPYSDTTANVTLPGTMTDHDWGEVTYVWAADNSSVTATRVCNTYADHVETETVAAVYTVPQQPTYTEKGTGKYTATFTNTGLGTAFRTVEIDSVREQLESALAASGSTIDDVDALLETAHKIVNGEEPYPGPCEDGYLGDLADLLAAYAADKDDQTKVSALADTLGSLQTLVDAYADHVVYTITYVLNGGNAENRTSYVRTDAAFTLNNPTRSGYVFAGWTGTGLDAASMSVTVNPADAENKTFTATWTFDNTDALAAVSNAAALIADVNDEFEDTYSQTLSDLVDDLNAALAADPQDADAIRSLTDAVNAKIAEKDDYKHRFNVNLGYKEGYEPTCTVAGVTVLGCENCDKTQEITAAALGHNWSEWTVVTPATYEADGEEQRVCSRCGETESRALHLTEEYDRQIRFSTISRMHYVIEVGDGYAVYNTNTILWYSSAELKFHVYVYSNFSYPDYVVYINGAEATPDENGVYTLPAGSTYDTVSIKGVTNAAPSSGEGESGTCPYCGQTHPNTLWGRLVYLFHVIFAFFRNLFKR